jgi:hypothetical protein
MFERFRHPELVSGSMPHVFRLTHGEAWMLKQVQHDGVGRERP